jgi:iron complex transport system substrate-binding protein
MLRTIITAAALFAAPAFAETVTIKTYGEDAEVPKNPQTVAVYDIGALDSISALGVKVQGVARPYFVSYLDGAVEGTEEIGSFFEPDFEALAALSPDLIIGGGRAQKFSEEFAKLAPTVDMSIWEDVVGQGLDRLEAYGQIFGKEAEAQKLADDFNAKLTEVKGMLNGQGKALILMTNGPKITTYGADGRFGWLHNDLGLPEAVEDVKATTHGEATSFEFVRDTNPDILFVVDRLAATAQEGDSAEKTLDNALIKETNAYKNGKIIYLSSGPVYISFGGIQSMNITLDEIKAALTK